MSCEQVNSGLIITPIGPYQFSSCGQGIHSLQMADQVTDHNFLALGTPGQVSLVDSCDKNSMARTLELWLQEFFLHRPYRPQAATPPVCAQFWSQGASQFRRHVWTTLSQQVPFGHTVSYAELCQMCGFRSSCSRAVGSAMAANQVCLLVPCHRVIKSDGTLGNYCKATRNTIKQWLLQHEQRNKP